MALRVRLRRPGIYLPIETCGEPIGSIQLTLTSTGSQDPLFSVAGSTFGEYVGQQEAITKLPAQRRVVQRMLRHAPAAMTLDVYTDCSRTTSMRLRTAPEPILTYKPS